MAGHSIQGCSGPRQILNHFFFFRPSLQSPETISGKQSRLELRWNSGGTPGNLRGTRGQ
ncbi:Hypothetical predicted protein [Marmota monax]|uniref:Uncharacterized protein n=1 Tax=Marmota monax TaxID=9995 RepID=A0A5E4C7P7_MARMO|nr:hypothetical protein GHT09_014744 [Marmota monax]VTJ77848.1 Hypothetical predicted protein [Marmota monax]